MKTRGKRKRGLVGTTIFEHVSSATWKNLKRFFRVSCERRFVVIFQRKRKETHDTLPSGDCKQAVKLLLASINDDDNKTLEPNSTECHTKTINSLSGREEEESSIGNDKYVCFLE